MASVELKSTRGMEGQNPSLDAEYLIEGCDNETDAIVALLDVSPAFWGSLVRQSAGAVQVGVDDPKYRRVHGSIVSRQPDRCLLCLTEIQDEGV